MARTAIAAAAISMAMLAPQANASVFEVTKQAGPSGSVFTGTGSRNVKISGPGLTGTPHVGAGGLALTAGAPSSLGNFIAFCLDIVTTFATPTDYVETDDPFTGTGQGPNPQGALGADRIELIQNLYDAVYSTLTPGAHTAWAGFQLALWEIVSETATSGTGGTSFGAPGSEIYYNASNGEGAFFATNQSHNSDGSVANKANEFIALAAGFNDVRKYRLIFLESQDVIGAPNGRDSQNLVTVAAVPLPAAGLLMAFALAGGAAAYRRRKAAA